MALGSKPKRYDTLALPVTRFIQLVGAIHRTVTSPTFIESAAYRPRILGIVYVCDSVRYIIKFACPNFEVHFEEMRVYRL